MFQIYDNDGYLTNYVGAPEEFFYDDQSYYNPYSGIPHETFEYGKPLETYEYANFS